MRNVAYWVLNSRVAARGPLAWLALGTAMLVAEPAPGVEHHGVVFVEDFQEQARRTGATPPQVAGRPVNVPRRGAVQPQPQPRQADRREPRANWTSKLTDMNPFRGLLSKDDQAPSDQATPSAAQQRRALMAQAAAAQAGQASQHASRRTAGLQQRPTSTANQPRGLLQLLGGDDDGREQATTSPAARDDRGGLPLFTRLKPRPSEQQPAPLLDRNGPVAMVSDQETPEPTAGSAVANRPNVPPAAVTSRAPSRTASQLPKVMGPAVSSDNPGSNRIQPVSVELADRPALARPQPVATRVPATKEIVNRHVNRAARSAAPARTTTPPNPIPENPAPAESTAAEPSAKAVEVLSAANKLSQTALTEKEYTQVVQMCRYVLAIDNSPKAVDYSHDLASWALNRRGELKVDQGRTKEALLDFQDALRLDPERWRAIHNRGVLAAQRGRYEEAMADFNRTIELNPKFAKAYANRALLHVQSDKLAEASADYQQAILHDPDLAVAHKGRGRVCHMLGQFDEALQHLDAASLLAPGDARIAIARGDLLSDMGRYQSALESYQTAVELDAKLAAAYRNLAWLQATSPDKQCRDVQQAVQNAERAVELSPEPGDLEYDTLAAAKAAAGDFAAALELMDRAMAVASDDAKPNYRWRRQLYERGQSYITEPASEIQQASYAE